MSSLPILCLDFDGVIHSYESGWHGADVIPDPAVPGAMEFIEKAVRRFKVAIYSSRSGQPNGILAMRHWVELNLRRCFEEQLANEVLALIEWPTEKPPALVTIDDRAICFTGIWPRLDTLAAFKPWNKLLSPTPARQHTPGPWTAECRDVSYKGGVWGEDEFLQFEVVGPRRPSGRGDYFQADALLVASAPDLLEACRFAASALSTDPVEVEYAQARLREVIAKATGVQP